MSLLTRFPGLGTRQRLLCTTSSWHHHRLVKMGKRDVVAGLLGGHHCVRGHVLYLSEHSPENALLTFQIGAYFFQSQASNCERGEQ